MRITDFCPVKRKNRLLIIMAKLLIYQLVIFLILVVVRPLPGFAREVIPSDTIPVNKKPVPEQPDAKKITEQPDVKKVTEQPLDAKSLDIIKEVPKSRRKLKPIAVPAPIPVKPIKIIKPKIIRRVI
jgi:hypothetical protein